MTWLAVFIGGGLGSLARFGVSKLVASLFVSSFPLATLVANILSCAVLGFISFKFPVSNQFYKTLLIIGFCGGFSTFSTFSYETLLLIKQNEWLYVIANVVISVVACLLILWAFARQ